MGSCCVILTLMNLGKLVPATKMNVQSVSVYISFVQPFKVFRLVNNIRVTACNELCRLTNMLIVSIAVISKFQIFMIRLSCNGTIV